MTKAIRSPLADLVQDVARVNVPDEWRRGTTPGRHYPKDCYVQSGRYLLAHADQPAILLAHGTIHAPVPIEHAWIEIDDGIVFDGVLQEFLQKQGYYEAFAIKSDDVYRYSLAEASRYMLQTQHWGYWEEPKWLQRLYAEHLKREVEGSV